jgi:hypothetical protein
VAGPIGSVRHPGLTSFRVTNDVTITAAGRFLAALLATGSDSRSQTQSATTEARGLEPTIARCGMSVKTIHRAGLLRQVSSVVASGACVLALDVSLVPAMHSRVEDGTLDINLT